MCDCTEREIPPREIVRLYPGKYKYKKLVDRYIPSLHILYDQHTASQTNSQIVKSIVFDLDETIGSFADLHIIWNSLFYSEYTLCLPTTDIQRKLFSELMEVYPEFIRYGMWSIMRYLYKKIQSGECTKLFIYTNNQCRYPEWVTLIMNYIDSKIVATPAETLFSKPVCAFKINNRNIEKLRTSKMKTHADFIRCTRLPRTAELCFIDDTYYTQMTNANVYYIQPPPYRHGISSGDLRDRLSTILMTLMSDAYVSDQYIAPTFSDIPPSVYKSDRNVHTYYQMMYYINEFFLMTHKKRKTLKRMIRFGRFTRRRDQK